MVSRRTTARSTTPWGRVSALLCGAVSTLIGIAAGLDPHVILQRAFVVSLIVGVFICCIRGLVQGVTAQGR